MINVKLVRTRALGLLLATLLLVGCQPSEPVNPTDSPTAGGPSNVATTGDPSPKFQLTSPDGTMVKFDPSENPDNEVFLLFFWSTDGTPTSPPSSSVRASFTSAMRLEVWSSTE